MILKKIQETASRYPDKTAVQMKIGDRYLQYTYRQLLSGIASTADSLSKAGIQKGDRVALLSENRPEWMISYLSVVCFGAVIVPLDAQLTEREVRVLLAGSEAKAVFVSAATSRKLPLNSSLLIVSFDEGPGVYFQKMLAANANAPIPPAPAAGDLAALLFTSGTTGDPKGVMLSNGNLASDCASCVKLDLVHDYDNMLCLLPLHHTYPAMTCMLLPFSVGATVTMLNSLKGPDILACMAETKVTIMLGVPLLYAGLRRAIFDGINRKPAPVRLIVKLLLTFNGFLRKTTGLNMGKVLFGKVHEMFGPSLKFFASGGARLEPDVYTDMTNLGFTVIEGYGLTETSPVSTFNPLLRQKAGSIGIQLPDVEVKIADPDESGQGEIAVRGPNVMLGYYKKPEETAAVLRDGWFYTGDLGYRDKDGYFFITGRSKEMIVLSTGKKIFPEELEKYYKQIPEIKEICLLQAERGLDAAVVPDFDYLKKMNLLNAREVISYRLEDLAKDLPPYKRITGLRIFKDLLPVTRLGKLRRTMVRDLYLTQGERAEKPVADEDRELLGTAEGKKLVACLEPFTAKKTIVPDDNLELDLGLDSLARMELVVSIEKSFGVALEESFGSDIFTVKDALLRIREALAGAPMEAGERVRLSWNEILAQEPSEEAKQTLTLEPGRVLESARYALQTMMKIIFTFYGRLHVSGLQNLPREGPYIIAPNHVSFADAPAVVAALPWEIASQTFFLGASVYFGRTVMSDVSKAIQVIPVDMETRLYNALQLSAYVLRNRRILCVFPEGARSRDGTLREFKKGVGIIAKELSVPIIPVAINGTYQMLAPGKMFPKPVKIRVTFGKPVQPADQDYDSIVKKLSEEVMRLAGQA